MKFEPLVGVLVIIDGAWVRKPEVWLVRCNCKYTDLTMTLFEVPFQINKYSVA